MVRRSKSEDLTRKNRPKNITDEGMRKMGMKIKELELLKSLHLEFFGYS